MEGRLTAFWRAIIAADSAKGCSWELASSPPETFDETLRVSECSYPIPIESTLTLLCILTSGRTFSTDPWLGGQVTSVSEPKVSLSDCLEFSIISFNFYILPKPKSLHFYVARGTKRGSERLLFPNPQRLF